MKRRRRKREDEIKIHHHELCLTWEFLLNYQILREINSAETKENQLSASIARIYLTHGMKLRWNMGKCNKIEVPALITDYT